MKKFLAVIIVLCAITPVFAGLSGDIGVVSGYDFYFAKYEGTEKYRQQQSIPLGVKGSLYFGDGSLAMGVDYGLDFFRHPLKSVYDDISVDLEDAESEWFLQPRVGFGLRYALGDVFALKGAVGGSFYYDSNTINGVKHSNTKVGIYVDLGLSVSMGSVALLGGVKSDFTVNSNTEFKSGGVAVGGKDKTSYIDVTPYVGIGYSF